MPSRRQRYSHLVCMSAVAATLGKRLAGRCFANPRTSLLTSSARSAAQIPRRIDVLSGHLGASPAARPVTERRSRAAMVAAATAAGMAGGVLVAEQSPKSGSESGLSFEQIGKLPRPGFQTIGAATFLPDGSHVLFLKSSECSAKLSQRAPATKSPEKGIS
ncbi:unnamed protein product [Effrenium voratum]|nr:unnamed protein product [Effrenium voratum]